MTLPRPVLALVASVAAATLLAACGGGSTGTSTGSSASVGVAVPPSAGGSTEAGGEVLTFPAEYGLPDLTPPDGGDVSPASGEDDDYVAFDVGGVDVDEALTTFGDQLRDAGFEVVESGATIQAGKEGAATVTVAGLGDGVLVDAQPPS